MAFLLSDEEYALFQEMKRWWIGDTKDRDNPGERRWWTSTLPDEQQLPLWIGKTTTAHDKGNTEAVDVYGKVGDTQGSETVHTLGENNRSLQVYNRFADVEDDKWVLVIPIGSGWELIAAEC